MKSVKVNRSLGSRCSTVYIIAWAVLLFQCQTVACGWKWLPGYEKADAQNSMFNDCQAYYTFDEQDMKDNIAYDVSLNGQNSSVDINATTVAEGQIRIAGGCCLRLSMADKKVIAKEWIFMNVQR